MENITLYYREGNSDKVYQASIRQNDEGYMVDFAYGRRGSTLTTGSKTSSPVPLAEAQVIYQKLIKEKTAKGYTPGANGTPYQNNASTASTKQPTGILPQLLNPIESSQVEALIRDPAWWMQEKMDGRRLLIKKEDSVVTGINRLGQAVALPASMIESASQSHEDFIIDGEGIGDTLHVFDAHAIDGQDIRPLRYGERYLMLMNLLGSFQHRHLTLVATAFSAAEKRALFNKLQQEQKEGVVFKHTDAPYTAGRPNTGGSQLKHKFYETASFIVTKLNVCRSVSLILFDRAKVVSAGNVTIPPNQNIPGPGQVIECRYLYAFKESGCIYQPVYLGMRKDIRGEECTTAQLKYKPEPVDQAA